MQNNIPRYYVIFSLWLLDICTPFVIPPTRISRGPYYLVKKNWSPPEESNSFESRESEDDGLVYSIELPKSAGISWGADLSFRFVYVLDLDPNMAAASSGVVKKGDYIVGMGDTNTIAQDFDYVLTTLAKQDVTFNYTFFRGTKEQMVGTPVLEPSEIVANVRVIQDGKPDVKLACPGGTNIRKLLVGNGINVYRSLTRWTNCNGRQLCGTCIVEVTDGGENCSRRAVNEEAVLRENPENYRLSCVTSVYGDITVKVQGPVGSAQWTR